MLNASGGKENVQNLAFLWGYTSMKLMLMVLRARMSMLAKAYTGIFLQMKKEGKVIKTVQNELMLKVLLHPRIIDIEVIHSNLLQL